MEAVIGLVGVALGATLAPFIDWARQRRARHDQRRRELLDLVAALVSTSGDQLVAESETPNADAAWTTQVASQAKAIGAAGGWHGHPVEAAYDNWKAAEQALIDAARAYLDPL